MSSELLVPPVEGWTTDDLDRMPMTGYRHELTDGVLSVSPSPANVHQMIAHRFANALEAVIRSPWEIAIAVEVRFERKTTRIPDLMIVESDEPGRHWFAPAEVVLAVEVESPGNHIDDRVTKPAIYSRFGIRHYWRVGTDPFRVTVYELPEDGETYAVSAPAERVTVSRPVTVDLGPDELLPRWAR